MKSVETITTSTNIVSTDKKKGVRKITCYSPLLRVIDLSKWEIAEDGHRYHPAKIEKSKDLENYDYYNSPYFKTEIIPCKKCIGCRLDYSREWANRGYLESLEYENNYFITLTYDDENITIPEEIEIEEITYTEIEEMEWKGTLIPKDITAFIKALRQEFKRKLNHDGIRFMACGEYGGKTKRPHYHIILFNAPFPIESFYNPRISWEKDVYYQNTIIEKCWKKGISNISEANWNTIAYTARYITKKINGKEANEYYGIQGQEREFFRTSRNPGIGRNYYEKHKKEIYEKDEIMIKNKKGVHYVKPPKYFDKIMEKEDPKLMKEIKERRNKQNFDNKKIKEEKTSLRRWEQLQVEKRSKEEKSKTLKRNLENEN